MKVISLNIDEMIFTETEELVSILKKSRNRYINEAIDHYNKHQNRLMLEQKLLNESEMVQTDLLNKIPHPSTLICPITTKVHAKSDVLRVHLKKGMANLRQDCDVLMDQLRVIDNKRLIKKIGAMPTHLTNTTLENLKTMLDLT